MKKIFISLLVVVLFAGCSYKSDVRLYQKELNQPLPYYIKQMVQRMQEKLPLNMGTVTYNKVWNNENIIYIKGKSSLNLKTNSSFDKGFNNGFIGAVNKDICRTPNIRVLIHRKMIMNIEIKGKDEGIIFTSINDFTIIAYCSKAHNQKYNPNNSIPN